MYDDIGTQAPPPRDDFDLLDDYSRTVTSAVEKAGPAVVNIGVRKKNAGARGGWAQAQVWSWPRMA